MAASDLGMVLLHPLFLALAALAALVPLLHRSGRRRVLRVPTLVLWQQLEGNRDATANRRRWRMPDLPMLLQMAVVILFAVALARPLVGSDPAAPRHRIYVVDAGAGMRATAGAVTRFDLAVARLAGLVAADVDPDGPRVSLVVAGPLPELLLARRRADHDLLPAVRERLQATDGAVDWPGVGRRIDEVRRPGEAAEVVLLTGPSDGGAGRLAATLKDVPLTVLHSGQATPDAALEARLAPAGTGSSGFRLSGRVRFSGGLEQTTMTVELRRAGAAAPLPLATAVVRAPADAAAKGVAATAPFGIDLPALKGGIVAVRLDGDANPAADAAWFVVDGEPAKTPILVVGKPRPALVKALGSLAGAAVEERDSLPADVARYRLVVVVDTVVDRPPETSTLWIGRARPAGTPEPPALAPGEVTSWRADHPLSRGILWSGVALARADRVVPWADGDSILAAGDTVLIEARSGRHGREVRLAFDPTREWAGQTSFPQFLDNLMEWLGPVARGTVRAGCTVGAACPLDARWYGGTLSAAADASAARPAPTIALPAPGGRFTPLRAGLYRLDGGGDLDLLAIAPAWVDPAGAAVADDGPAAEAPAPPLRLWPWLVAAAGLALAAEAWIAHRRRRAPRWLPATRLVLLALLAAALFDLPAPWLDPATDTAVVIGTPVAGAEAVVTPAGPAAVAVGDGLRVAADFGETGPLAAPAMAEGAVADAIRLAAAMLPAERSGRLVLGGRLDLSGTEIADLAPGLARRGIAVDVATDPAMPRGEVAVAAVEAPQTVFAGESFTLTGRLRAAQATRVQLTARADGAEIARQEIDLAAGDTPVEITVPKAKAGDAFYEMAITAPGDTVSANDAGGTWVRGRAPPRVLVLGLAPAGRTVADGLVRRGLAATVAVPTGAPWLIEDWVAYDAFVFVDVPAIALSSTQQALVADAVSRHGRPLLLLGGPHAFGPGGYLETTLDRLSPLSSRIPKPSPEAAVVFVLDRSGSMAQAVGDVDRLEIARQATLSALSLLNPASKAGIVAFDTEARVVAPLQPVAGIARIRSAMATMTPGGGTDLFPAMGIAFEQLRDADSSLKHVIVFTDGLIPPAAFDPLVGSMAAAGISISTVSIGTGGGDNVLRAIAKAGGGAFHATNDFRALPSILSQETMLLSDSAVEERRTAPVWVGVRPRYLSGLPASLPEIAGYVMTTPKPDATVSLKVTAADGGDVPLLASWQYGSGKVLALATQAAGPWTQPWSGMPGMPTLWAEAVEQLLSGADAPGLTLRAARRGDEAVITATALDKARRPRSGLTLAATVAPRGPGAPEAARGAAVVLVEGPPGVYEGRTPRLGPGDYEIRLADGDSAATALVHLAFPQRLAFDPALERHAALAAATGGSSVAWAAMPWPAPQRELVVRPYWPFWALAALTAFLVELLARYGALARPAHARPRARS